MDQARLCDSNEVTIENIWWTFGVVLLVGPLPARFVALPIFSHFVTPQAQTPRRQ
jgi:hypothetical protein